MSPVYGKRVNSLKLLCKGFSGSGNISFTYFHLLIHYSTAIFKKHDKNKEI